MTMGKVIRQLRISSNITQEKLASHLKVSSQAVSKWETDAVMPDIGMIVPIARFFGVSTDTLFGLEKPPENPYKTEREKLLTRYECSHDDDDFLAAKREYEKVICSDEITTDDLMSYAYLLDQNAKINTTRAAKWYEKAIEHGENNRDEYYYKAHNQLIIMLARNRNNDDVVKRFEKLLEKEMDNIERYVSLGLAYRATGNSEKAYDILKKGMELEENNISILTFLGDVCTDIGRYDEAVDYYDRAYKADSLYCSCLYGKAFLYEKSGNIEMAVKAWNEVIEWLEKEGFVYAGELDLPTAHLNDLMEKAAGTG